MTDQPASAAPTDVFGGALLIRPRRAFRLLSIGSTKGYELIRAGVIETAQVGRSRMVRVDSLRRLVSAAVKDKVDA